VLDGYTNFSYNFCSRLLKSNKIFVSEISQLTQKRKPNQTTFNAPTKIPDACKRYGFELYNRDPKQTIK